MVKRRPSAISLPGLVSFSSLILLLNGCGISEKISAAKADATAAQAAAESDYASFDMTCSFDDITAASDAKTAAVAALVDDAAASSATAAAASACDGATEQYAALLSYFDADGDGELAGDELSEAEKDYDAEQLTTLDADGDGKVSDAEKATFRKDKLPVAQKRREEDFKKNCEALDKAEDDCRKLRDDHKEVLKKQIVDRTSEFDKDADGKLDEAERAAMKAALDAEDAKRRQDFDAAKGKDEKLGPADRQARRDDLKKEHGASVQAKKPQGAPPPGPGTPAAPQGAGSPPPDQGGGANPPGPPAP